MEEVEEGKDSGLKEDKAGGAEEDLCVCLCVCFFPNCEEEETRRKRLLMLFLIFWWGCLAVYLCVYVCVCVWCRGRQL